MGTRDTPPAKLARVGKDAASQTGGIVIVAAAAVIFIAAAIGGLSLLGRLGTFGYIAYAVVLSVLALGLGPVLATGMSIRRQGSPRARAEAQARLEAQRRKFQLVAPEAERAQERLTRSE